MPIPALLLAMAAQAVAAPQPQRHFDRPFLSPMGEPFRAAPGGDALETWFIQADRNHDNVLTADEMEADAARFFLRLDINHDGEIDPDEIQHYESVIAPEIETTPGARIAQARVERQSGQGGGSGHRGGGHHHGGGGYGGDSSGAGDEPDYMDDPIGGGRFGLLNIPEPVSSADADFNRGVSLDEFKKAAVQRFELLDTSHAGRLTLAQLESQRAATIAASRRRHAPSAAASEDDSQSDMPPF